MELLLWLSLLLFSLCFAAISGSIVDGTVAKSELCAQRRVPFLAKPHHQTSFYYDFSLPHTLFRWINGSLHMEKCVWATGKSWVPVATNSLFVEYYVCRCVARQSPVATSKQICIIVIFDSTLSWIIAEVGEFHPENERPQQQTNAHTHTPAHTRSSLISNHFCGCNFNSSSSIILK